MVPTCVCRPGQGKKILTPITARSGQAKLLSRRASVERRDLCVGTKPWTTVVEYSHIITLGTLVHRYPPRYAPRRRTSFVPRLRPVNDTMLCAPRRWATAALLSNAGEKKENPNLGKPPRHIVRVQGQFNLCTYYVVG